MEAAGLQYGIEEFGASTWKAEIELKCSSKLIGNQLNPTVIRENLSVFEMGPGLRIPHLRLLVCDLLIHCCPLMWSAVNMFGARRGSPTCPLMATEAMQALPGGGWGSLQLQCNAIIGGRGARRHERHADHIQN